jgi:DNA-binding transcriptional regulator/RsmH inhibitor MraZ
VSFPPYFKKLFEEKELIVREDIRGNYLILSTVEEFEKLPKDIRENINAYPVKIDNKVRITIPKLFRKTVKIKRILFKGAGNHVELWQKEE